MDSGAGNKYMYYFTVYITYLIVQQWVEWRARIGGENKSALNVLKRAKGHVRDYSYAVWPLRRSWNWEEDFISMAWHIKRATKADLSLYVYTIYIYVLQIFR